MRKHLIVAGAAVVIFLSAQPGVVSPLPPIGVATREVSWRERCALWVPPDEGRQPASIAYAIPRKAFVTLKVFNVLGREVATVDEGMKNFGVHTVRFVAGDLPMGMYFTRLQSGSTVLVKKMLLTK